MASVDPTEQVRQWTTAIFVIVLAAAWIPIFVWEMVIRMGVDWGVDSALTGALGVIVAGRVILGRKGDE